MAYLSIVRTNIKNGFLHWVHHDEINGPPPALHLRIIFKHSITTLYYRPIPEIEIATGDGEFYSDWIDVPTKEGGAISALAGKIGNNASLPPPATMKLDMTAISKLTDAISECHIEMQQKLADHHQQELQRLISTNANSTGDQSRIQSLMQQIDTLEKLIGTKDSKIASKDALLVEAKKLCDTSTQFITHLETAEKSLQESLTTTNDQLQLSREKNDEQLMELRTKNEKIHELEIAIEKLRNGASATKEQAPNREKGTTREQAPNRKQAPSQEENKKSTEQTLADLKLKLAAQAKTEIALRNRVFSLERNPKPAPNYQTGRNGPHREETRSDRPGNRYDAHRNTWKPNWNENSRSNRSRDDDHRNSRSRDEDHRSRNNSLPQHERWTNKQHGDQRNHQGSDQRKETSDQENRKRKISRGRDGDSQPRPQKRTQSDSSPPRQPPPNENQELLSKTSALLEKMASITLQLSESHHHPTPPNLPLPQAPTPQYQQPPNQYQSGNYAGTYQQQPPNGNYQQPPNGSYQQPPNGGYQQPPNPAFQYNMRQF